ncbi:MAG TPA: aminopeptidase, partial [Planctomycetes bacterium]|nr:aminopeptidase [Planctomycetota bacterium]
MDLNRALDRYAELLVSRGANVQPGQTLQLTCDAIVRDFALRIVEAAYDRGARFVQFDLIDER